jgi:hypothetical protein
MLGQVLRVLRRSAATFWVASLACALLGAAVLRGAAIDRARPWGDLRNATVMVRAAGPGYRLRADDLRADRVPERFAREPMGDPAALVGRTLVRSVAAGWPLEPGDLASRPVGPLAARAGAGRSVVAVEMRPGALPLRLGDRVSLLVTPEAAGVATVVARGLTVVERGEGRASVSVLDADLPRIAAALTGGLVTLALEGG